METPFSAIFVLVILCIFILFQCFKPNFVHNLKILFIPVILFGVLIGNYNKGIVYHGIVDTIVALVAMLCIKVREYIFPLFYGQERVIIPIKDLTKEALIESIVSKAPKIIQLAFSVLESKRKQWENNPNPHNTVKLLSKTIESIIKFILCILQSYKRTFYNQYPDIPNWAFPLSNLKILTSGILFLILIYIFFPFLAKGVAFVCNSNRKWLNVNYTKYGILLGIFTIFVILFTLRFYIYNKINSIFYEGVNEDQLWLNELTINLQEKAFTHMNIYETIILISIAYFFIYSISRLPITSSNVENSYLKLLFGATAVSVIILVSFKIIRNIFVTSGFLKFCLRNLSQSEYSLGLKDFGKSVFPNNFYLVNEKEERFTSGSEIVSIVSQYGREEGGTRKKLHLNFLMNVDTDSRQINIGKMDCEIERKFNKDNSIKKIQSNCKFLFDDVYKKETIQTMFNKLSNNSEIVQTAAIPITKYLSYHVLPVVFAITFAYLFTKLHRILNPEKKYKDSDMLIETFLIFLCGFYPLTYILVANESNYIITVLCIVCGLVTLPAIVMCIMKLQGNEKYT